MISCHYLRDTNCYSNNFLSRRNSLFCLNYNKILKFEHIIKERLNWCLNLTVWYSRLSRAIGTHTVKCWVSKFPLSLNDNFITASVFYIGTISWKLIDIYYSPCVFLNSQCNKEMIAMFLYSLSCLLDHL